MSSTIEKMMTRAIFAIKCIFYACISELPAVSRHDHSARDMEGPCMEKSPGRERISRRPRELSENLAMLLFWLGLLFIALMLLLGLAMPAIVMLGLELLLLEHRACFRTSIVGKRSPG